MNASRTRPGFIELPPDYAAHVARCAAEFVEFTSVEFRGMQIYFLEDLKLEAEIKAKALLLGFDKIFRLVHIRRPPVSPVTVVQSRLGTEISKNYWSDSWYRHDPIWTHSLRSSEPLILQTIARTPQSLPLWQARKEFGQEFGICIAVHDRNGVISFLKICRATPVDMDPLVLTPLLARLREIAYFSHTASMQSIFPALLAAENPDLSAREQECLEWTSRGKTASEIGDILYISADTVTFHIKKFVAKLGATNKFHACAIAASRGLVAPEVSLFGAL